MVVGNHLNHSEIKSLISNIPNMQKFKGLVEMMNKQENLSLIWDKAEVRHAYQFDFVLTEDVIISAKSLHVETGKDVMIRYFTSVENGDSKTFYDFFIGTISKKSKDGKGYEVNSYITLRDGTISKLEGYQDKEYLQETLDEFPVPFNENYYPGQLLEEGVQLQSLIDGCLPGGYIWCGQKCGGSAACLSGSPWGKNGLDNCCKDHDCCYHRNNVKSRPHCMCDATLVGCAMSRPYVPIYTDVVIYAFKFSCPYG